MLSCYGPGAMILKGNQRAGGDDLATHLMNEFDNDLVEVGQIRGTVAEHLHGAFAEYEAHAAGTRCKEPLYSLSINPSAPIPRDQYYAAIDRIEQSLGLSGQARAVVFHVKHGREHAHVVWSRIDTAKMRAVQLSHDRRKLRSLSRELAHEFGLELPEGLARDLRAERVRKKDVTLAEKAQSDATGITPGQRRSEITEAFRRSDSAEAFRAALQEKGYALARGERRDYVVIDRYGKVHSLARQIDGVRTRELKEKLASIEERAASVDEAKAALEQASAAARARIDQRVIRGMSELSAKLSARQAGRRRKLDGRAQEIATEHGAERMSLGAAHKSEQGSPFARAAGAIFALFDRVPGLRSVIAPLRRNPHFNPAERQRIEREALERRHQRERFALDRRHKALGRLETRELRSLENAVRRQVREMETARELKAETAHDALEVNKLDISLPGDMKAAGKSREAKASKEGRERLGLGPKQGGPGVSGFSGRSLEASPPSISLNHGDPFSRSYVCVMIFHVL